MKLLIIEDDQNKLKQINDFLREQFPDIDIVEKYSYNSGIKEIFYNKYDILLLDMTMPTFDISPNETGGRPRIFGGKDILKQMNRRNIKLPVIIVTQFEKFGEGSSKIALADLCEELERSYKECFFGYVYYNAALDKWKDELKENIIKVKELK